MNTKNKQHGQWNKSSEQKPEIGFLEWFHLGDYEHVEAALQQLETLGVQKLRTGFSWADYYAEGGPEWYDWLIPKLAEKVDILPCFLYTPPSIAVEPKTSAPPRDPKAFADFLDLVMKKYGQYFDWVELWNEPNNRSEYDYTLDRGWNFFAEMIKNAAHWMQHLGKKTLLGGISPIDPNWLDMIAKKGVLECFDAIGVHGFPGVFDSHWQGWPKKIRQVRAVLDKHEVNPQIWITECGYSTWKHDEKVQLREFLEASEAPAERMYWYSLNDLDTNRPTVDGFHLDEREYHFGICAKNKREKLLYKLLAEQGTEKLATQQWLASDYTTPSTNGMSDQKHVLITGGAGFIGTNLASTLLDAGHQVKILDNLSRDGVQKNLRWLRKNYPNNLSITIGDMRNEHVVSEAVKGVDMVFHFAAQVAVTTSFEDPMHDFEVNVKGTLNLLQAINEQPEPPGIIFTSTNKVYGGLENVVLIEEETRYSPANYRIMEEGISESQKLDFHSPYGCSKGAADQYVLDHARSMGLKTAVFRMSCIYGPHQHGTEDQGWVAHFLISALNNQPLTLYGDGKQVRDIMHVDDLMNAFLTAWENLDTISGQAFNIGGGVNNSVSLGEMMGLIEEVQYNPVNYKFSKWRAGDQKYYVTNTRKFEQATGWKPRIRYRQGLLHLYEWLMNFQPSVKKSRSVDLIEESIT